jgi:hypothetical protein
MQLALLAFILACSSPDQQLQQSTLTVRSWVATLATTAEALRSGAVPRGYGEQILRAADQTRQKEERTPEWQRLPSALRDSLQQARLELSSLLNTDGSGRP